MVKILSKFYKKIKFWIKFKKSKYKDPFIYKWKFYALVVVGRTNGQII